MHNYGHTQVSYFVFNNITSNLSQLRRIFIAVSNLGSLSLTISKNSLFDQRSRAMYDLSSNCI